MPGNKHLRGVGSEEQKMYEHIKELMLRTKLETSPCCGMESMTVVSSSNFIQVELVAHRHIFHTSLMGLFLILCVT